jgi:hypothetical protein
VTETRLLVSALRDTGAGGPAVTIGGIGVWGLLRDRLEGVGWRLVDHGELAGGELPAGAVGLWDFGSHAHPPRAFREQSQRVVAWSLESPLIAHRAYHRLGRIGHEAGHVFAFGGAGPLLTGTPAAFHEVHWPNDMRPPVKGPPWEERRLISLINSNKRAHHWRTATAASGTRQAARVAAAGLLASSYRWRGTWSSPELYVDRLKAIEHFSRRDGFDLYGAGWDRPVPGGSRYRVAVARSYRGAVRDKNDALSPYRFSLVIENTAFPGYVSEKVYDCMFGNTIPVYLGAPDVGRRLPEGSYLDLREYESLAHLEDALRSMDESQAQEHLSAGREFVQSDAFRPFTASCFAEQLWAAVSETAWP